MATEALILLVFAPLLAACLTTVLRGQAVTWVAALTLATLPLLLIPLTLEVVTEGRLEHALGGYQVPLGIRLVADGAAMLLLWLVAVVGGLSGVNALFAYRGKTAFNNRFWPLWLVMVAGLNGLFLSVDLFNLYIALELITLASVPLIALAGGATALKAAMRYLLLAMLGSLAYLLGVALIYNATGTLDYRLLADLMEPGPGNYTALALVTVGLLLKSAVFPLHIWLPRAHASAPGPVSAVLSALVVKASIYLLWRIWYYGAINLELGSAELLLGIIGAMAIIYGCLAALVQVRLKMVVAYSTVAQLGYLMMLFPLTGSMAWEGAMYYLMAHAFAKSAMFLAAANILHAEGTDRLDELSGLDRRQPVSLFTFALGGVSIMALPVSGGFLAKWMLLESALAQEGWFWMVIMVSGGLLSAAYIFRVMAATVGAGPNDRPASKSNRLSQGMVAPALILALLAVGAGFGSAPVLMMLGGIPAGLMVATP